MPTTPSRLDRVLLAVAGGFTVLIALRIYPLGSTHSWISLYRTHVLAQWSLLLFFVASLLALAIAGSPLLLPRLGPRRLLPLLMLAVIVLNLALHRPLLRQVWMPRAAFNGLALTNPFLARGLQIGDLDAYFGADREHADRGYWATIIEQRRLTTYPAGLPPLYRLIDAVANANPTLRTALVAAATVELGSDLSRRDVALSEDDRTVATASLASALHLLAIGLIPLAGFGLARTLLPAAAAYSVAVLLAFVPAFHLFAATPDALYPALGLALLWAAIVGQRRNSWPLLATSAVLVGLGCALSYALVPFGLLTLLLLLFLDDDRPRLRPLLTWLAAGAGTYFALRVLAFDVIARFFVVMGNNQEFYRGAERSYGESLLFNVVTFVAFAGVLWVGGFVHAVFRGARDASQLGWRALSPLARFSVLFAGVLTITLVSGGTRGEVERNWMLLMPYLVLGASPLVGDSPQRTFAYGVAGFTIIYVMALLIETSFTF